MTKYVQFITLCCFIIGFILACNKDIDLDQVNKDVADNSIEIARMEDLVTTIANDFNSMRILLTALDQSLNVKSYEIIRGVKGDSISITFNNNSKITLHGGFTPLVEVRAGEVYLNGKPTGYQPKNGIDGTTVKVEVDDVTGNFIVDGIVLDINSQKGAAGYSPKVEVKDGFFYINDLKTEMTAMPIDGVADTFKYLNGKLSLNGVLLDVLTDGTKGETGDKGASGKPISQITLTADNNLKFDFGGSVETMSMPIELDRIKIKLNDNFPKFVVNKPEIRTYSIDRAGVSLSPYKVPKNWIVAIDEEKMEITITPLTGAQSDVILLIAIDAKGHSSILRLVSSF